MINIKYKLKSIEELEMHILISKIMYLLSALLGIILLISTWLLLRPSGINQAMIFFLISAYAKLYNELMILRYEQRFR